MANFVRMFRRILCTVLTGLSNIRAIPRKLHGFTPPLDSSCTTLTTSWVIVELILFFPLPDCTSKEPVFSNFWIIFNRRCTVIGPTIFFIPLNVRNCCRASSAQSLFLQKSFSGRARFFIGTSCQTSQTRNEEKSCTRGFYYNCMSRADNRHFPLHILMLIALSVAKIWNYFLLCHTLSLFFNMIPFKFDVILNIGSFFNRVLNLNFNYCHPVKTYIFAYIVPPATHTHTQKELTFIFW